MTDFATYAESVITELKGQNKLKAAESRRFISSSFIRFMGDDISADSPLPPEHSICRR